MAETTWPASGLATSGRPRRDWTAPRLAATIGRCRCGAAPTAGPHRQRRRDAGSVTVPAPAAPPAGTSATRSSPTWVTAGSIEPGVRSRATRSEAAGRPRPHRSARAPDLPTAAKARSTSPRSNARSSVFSPTLTDRPALRPVRKRQGQELVVVGGASRVRSIGLWKLALSPFAGLWMTTRPVTGPVTTPTVKPSAMIASRAADSVLQV